MNLKQKIKKLFLINFHFQKISPKFNRAKRALGSLRTKIGLFILKNCDILSDYL